MESHTTPAGISSDEAMSQGWRFRKLRSANVAVNVPNTCGPPTIAVTPRLMLAEEAPSQTAINTAGTITTLATSIKTSNVALLSQGHWVVGSSRSSWGASNGSSCQV